jgi:hypothetical protein
MADESAKSKNVKSRNQGVLVGSSAMLLYLNILSTSKASAVLFIRLVPYGAHYG